MTAEREIPKRFDPAEVEAKWQKRWEEAGVFRAGRAGGEPFVIVIPPPNVTGALHMGHALNNTLQDIYARYKRMDGRDVLWLPGTDHAGIATQNVVERQLMAEGKKKEDLGRDAFVARVWKWKEESGGRITEQLRRLGASCDWSRERFTMDEGLSRAVREVFVRLYEEGLVYRGERLVNWCPRCRTALSDIEVEHEEVDGNFWYIRYPFAEGDGGVVIATTRPETMLGDTAVAVHPDDARYRDLIGREVVLPLHGRKIPIIADERVDREFGTGAVKVTPAHDPLDEAIGRTHDLPFIKAFTEDGRISEATREGLKRGEPAEAYVGFKILDCRKVIVGDLKEAGFLVRTEPHRHAVGHCYRCKTVVEPYLTPQWYVRMKPLAEKAAAAVREGRTRITPEMWEKTYFHWLENIRDWCVSRQIWWGHRIPAWYCKACGPEPIVAREAPPACPKCGGGLVEDEDVLDTWFSSALWPFSTLGWPEETEDLRRYYPTTLLITGFDILFFWVARMMMMGVHFMGEPPFADVYLHGLVRDPEGRKMSKSKGNVVDPLEVMEEYGTDAFRFALAALTSQGRDLKLDRKRIEGFRNFATKVWNAARLVLSAEPKKAGEVRPEDDWIRARRDAAVLAVRAGLDAYDVGAAAEAVYRFFWSEYCDWYLEIAKPRLHAGDAAAVAVAREVLDDAARLLHPFMPHVTEEIHALLGHDDLLATAKFPRAGEVRDVPEVGLAVEAVTAIRRLRADLRVPPGATVRAEIVAEGATAEALSAGIETIARLASAEVEVVSVRPTGSGVVVEVGRDFETALLLEGVVDLAAERKRIEEEIEGARKGVASLERRLADPKFREKAPEEVVEGVESELEVRRARLERLEAVRAGLA